MLCKHSGLHFPLGKHLSIPCKLSYLTREKNELNVLPVKTTDRQTNVGQKFSKWRKIASIFGHGQRVWRQRWVTAQLKRFFLWQLCVRLISQLKKKKP